MTYLIIWCLIGLLFHLVGIRHLKNKEKLDALEQEFIKSNSLIIITLIICMICGPLLLLLFMKKPSKS